MSLLVLPVTAGLMALALPAMRVVSFGAASADGPGLLAAALAALAVGLLPYGAFLLLARAYYALGDSRTPGLVSLGSAVVGVVVMALGAFTADGRARVAVLGAGHSVAYAVGAAVLFAGLARRAGGDLWPQSLGRMVATSAGVGLWRLARGSRRGSTPTRAA